MIYKQHPARLDNARFLSLVAVEHWGILRNVGAQRALQDQKPHRAHAANLLRPDKLQVTNFCCSSTSVVKGMIRYSCTEALGRVLRKSKGFESGGL
jgi:hypothetical protein